MPPTLVIHSDAAALGLSQAVGLQLLGLSVGDPAKLDAEIAAATQSGSDMPVDLSAREVVGFRRLFARLGYQDQVPAGERLRRSFSENGFKRFGALIDSYNLASFDFTAGLGMHDLDRLGREADIHVWRAAGDERIVPMFQAKPKTVKQGDIVYGLRGLAGSTVAAWLGKRDVDSDEFKVTDDTEAAFLIVLGNECTTREYNLRIAQRVSDLLALSGACNDVRFIETAEDAE